MITKVEINGKERVAIVLGEWDEIDDARNIHNGLTEALQTILVHENARNYISSDGLYTLTRLLTATMPYNFNNIPLEDFNEK